MTYKSSWKAFTFKKKLQKKFQISTNCQVMSPHHSDQMSQRSQVSRVALCMSKSKGVSLSQWVSEWVSEWQCHLLSCQTLVWTAKNFHFFFKWCKTAKSILLIFGFDNSRQIFEKLFAKNMKGGSDKSEILHVGQLGCAEKKSRK